MILRKGIGVFLFICLIAPFIFCYSWLTIGKQSVRREIKQKILHGIDKESLIHLSFTRVEADLFLRWKESDEFEYKGQMFDVVETEITGDTLHFRCYWDHKESVLKAQINNLLAKFLGQHSTNKENQKRLISIFQTVYLQDHFNWISENHFINKESYSDSWFMLKGIYSEPPVPPPRHC